MSKESDAWAERVWAAARATALDFEHRALAISLSEIVEDNPELAGSVIAALVQQANAGISE